jgi:hypothetical protein
VCVSLSAYSAVLNIRVSSPRVDLELNLEFRIGWEMVRIDIFGNESVMRCSSVDSKDVN